MPRFKKRSTCPRGAALSLYLGLAIVMTFELIDLKKKNSLE